MAETYCGKSCAQCQDKEKLQCPGCKLGPGKHHSGDCDIAKCCRENGHMSCDTCTHSRNYCAKYNTRDGAASARLQKQEREARKQQIAQKRAVVLGKWLWIVFWLRIANEINSIFGSNLLGSLSLVLGLVSSIVALAISIAIVAIYLKLGDQDSGYRTGAICMLVASVMNVAMTLFSGAIDGTGLSILISIPITVAGLLGQYKIYMAHSVMLTEVDDELSEKWAKLWKWYIILFAVTLGSVVITFLAALLGILLALVGAVGTLVVGIMEIVYLYKTAKAFQNYAGILQLTN